MEHTQITKPAILGKLTQLLGQVIQPLGVIVKGQNWDFTPGQSKSFTWYSGVEAGNPSGNKNLKSITYLIGGVNVVTRTFTYDADDDVLTITGS